MAGNDRGEAWRNESEVASASGGHLSPDTAGSVLGRSSEPTSDPTVPMPSSAARESALTTPGTTQRPRRRRVAIRRVKRTLRHVDPLSVLKISLLFYACLLVLWLAFVAILYVLAGAAGVFEVIESIGRGFALGNVEISLLFLERWAFLLGLTFGIIASLANLFFAFLYNVVADFVGGIEMTFVERDA